MATPRREIASKGDGAVPRTEIRLLGRFTVRRGGEPVPAQAFGGRLARRLLRMLALSRGTLLPKDVAAEALWPVRPPADASGNVEILVSRIRRALGDRSLVETGPGGYVLAGDDRCWVDVEAFLTYVVGGQARLGDDPAAALTAYRRALALWRGEPLAEDIYADWAQIHRRHLWRAYLDALEGAATAALALGDATSAVTWAVSAAERQPLREAAAMLAVHALAASGDRAAALATFDTFARRLADELGVDPSADALELRQRVLRGEIRQTTGSGSRAPMSPVGSPPPVTAVASLESMRRARRRVRDGAVRLSADRYEVLALLSVRGRSTPAGILAEATGRDLHATLDALSSLRRAGLVVVGRDGWAAVTDDRRPAADLDRGEQRRLHLLLAQALRGHGADAAEVADHLARGGERQAAADLFAEAARRRLGEGADREALHLATSGLALDPHGGADAALLTIRGEARRRRGHLREARVDLECALAATGRGPQRSRLLARLAILETRSRDAVRGGELIELAIAEAGDDPAARGQALAAGAIVDLMLERLDRAARRFLRARALLSEAGDVDGTARLLYWRGLARFIVARLPDAATELGRLAGLLVTPEETLRLWPPAAVRGHVLVFMAEPARGLAEIDAVLARARAVGHPATQSSCLWHRSEALAALGRPDEAVASAQAALDLARRIGHAELTAASLRGLGVAHQAAGALEPAEAAFRESLHVARHAPLFAAWATARLGLVLVAQGRLTEAEPMIVAALTHSVPLIRHEARWARAELARAQGRRATAAIAATALTAAQGSGYLALAPRLAELAGS